MRLTRIVNLHLACVRNLYMQYRVRTQAISGGNGHEKETRCCAGGPPDRGVRVGRIRPGFPSHAGSLCRERPEAGSSDRKSGDGSAGDGIRTRLHGHHRGEGADQSRLSRRRQDRGTACECRSAGQSRSAADADRRDGPSSCAQAKRNAVVAARASVVQLEADERRYAKLMSDGWVSRQRYEQAKAASDTAEAQLAGAEADARVAENEAAYSVLVADADGTVVETLG